MKCHKCIHYDKIDVADSKYKHEFILTDPRGIPIDSCDINKKMKKRCRYFKKGESIYELFLKTKNAAITGLTNIYKSLKWYNLKKKKYIEKLIKLASSCYLGSQLSDFMDKHYLINLFKTKKIKIKEVEEPYVEKNSPEPKSCVKDLINLFKKRRKQWVNG